MKLSNIKEVKELVKIRERCQKALDAATDGSEDEILEKDCGGVEGFDTGYWGQYSMHTDGSGWKMDMNGCYVAAEVLEALSAILDRQIKCVNVRLEELGVDPSS